MKKLLFFGLIALTMSQAYQPYKTKQSIYINDELTKYEVLNINGYNYIRLRDMAQLDHTKIQYNEQTNSVIIKDLDIYAEFRNEVDYYQCFKLIQYGNEFISVNKDYVRLTPVDSMIRTSFSFDELSKYSNNTLDGILTADTPEQRIKLSELLRVYIDEVQVYGTLRHEQHMGTPEYHFEFDNSLDDSKVHTVVVELGYE
jgi:hypothetical protein